VSEQLLRCPGGERRWLQWVSRGLFSEDGRLLEIQHVGRDITEIKRTETLLREAKAVAESADHAKSALLAGMSHELRTPLNGILGFAQVLQAQYFGDLNEKQKEYVDDILSSGETLLGLIDRLLDIANLDTGDARLDLSAVQVDELLHDCLDLVRVKCEKHSIDLRLDLAPSVDGLVIETDPRKARQVMFLLLSNAVKFTPEPGSITVEADAGDELAVSVADTGVGMSRPDMEKAFDDFYQARNDRLVKTPGAGLGLSLVARLVKVLGGRVHGESKGKDQGSRFTFTLPLKHAPARAADSGG
jgi:signal transduction histidine kinase